MFQGMTKPDCIFIALKIFASNTHFWFLSFHRVFAEPKKLHLNTNSTLTRCLLLLQAKRTCSVKYRSWFNQLWTVTMSVYSLMDKQAREKLIPWRGTLRTTINREWFLGLWNKCSGLPRTSKKRAGRWATIMRALGNSFRCWLTPL